jgi:glycosyltransferase involved in cell wall biosynthesis
MVDNQPLVSVIIPCYNAERWIAEAIESCLQQTYKPTEIIIIDDGSTDGSLTVIKEYAERYPELIKWETQKNQGAPAARNRAMDIASGDLIFYLDADDCLYASSIECLTQALRDDIDIVYGNTCYINSDGALTRIKDQSPASVDWVITMFEKNPLLGSVLLRKKAAKLVRWDTSLPCAQEYAYFVELAIQGCKFAHVLTTISSIREHSSPDRIGNSTKEKLLDVVTSLILRFEEQLVKSNQYYRERRIVINYWFFYFASRHWRKGNRSQVNILCSKVDKSLLPEYPKFKYLSFTGLAWLTSLRVCYVLWETRDRFESFLRRNYLRILSSESQAT